MHPLEEIRSRLWEFYVRRSRLRWELWDGHRTLSDGEVTSTVRVSGAERKHTQADTLEELLAATPDRTQRRSPEEPLSRTTHRGTRARRGHPDHPP